MNIEFSAFIDPYCYLQKLDFEGQNDRFSGIIKILCVYYVFQYLPVVKSKGNK